MADNYYMQVTDSIKSVYELSARIDERVKSMMNKQDQLENKIDNILKEYNNLKERVTVIEESESCATHGEVATIKDTIHNIDIRLQALEIRTGGHDSKWQNILEFVKQIIWIVIAAYVLTKLGLQSPAVP